MPDRFRRTPAFDRLPAELKVAIVAAGLEPLGPCQYTVDERRTMIRNRDFLYCTSLVCRSLNSVATPLLYATVVLDEYTPFGLFDALPRLKHFMRTATSRPDLLPLIRELHCSDPVERALLQRALADWAGRLPELASLSVVSADGLKLALPSRFGLQTLIVDLDGVTLATARDLQSGLVQLSSLTRLELDSPDMAALPWLLNFALPKVVDVRINFWFRDPPMTFLWPILRDIGLQLETLHLLPLATEIQHPLALDLPTLCPHLRTLALDTRWTVFKETAVSPVSGQERPVDWSTLKLDLLLLGGPLTDPRVASPQRLLSPEHAALYIRTVKLLRPKRVALAKLDLGAGRRWTTRQWDEVRAFAARVYDVGGGCVLEDRFGRVVVADGQRQGV